jgi:CPA2 family monovalent cation:H+ antiporter-2
MARCLQHHMRGSRPTIGRNLEVTKPWQTRAMAMLTQVLLLLGVAVGLVAFFQFLRIPSPLAYLLAGILLGPYTVGPVVDPTQLEQVAGFGIVFLLFTIGLSYSVAEFRTFGGRILGLGAAQVFLTTAVVAAAAWWLGLAAAAAFVVGAVFAQSSTTIMGKQLEDQGEENSKAGRLGLGMSVFQDLTAVPFVIVIPVLGVAAAGATLWTDLGLAMVKAAVAVAVVIFAGRWVIRPLFHLVTRRHSAELFTLTVLLVVLVSAWLTDSLGLSQAFGAFLAGMVMGGTEFRHQVKESIRPFRDVLLGLFFVVIGMLVDPGVIPDVWYWVLLGTAVLLSVKIVLVTGMVRIAGIGWPTAIRTGLILAVGGEFGFALLAIAFNARVVEGELGQILLLSVMLAMVIGALLIRYNRSIAGVVTGVLERGSTEEDIPHMPGEPMAALTDHIVIAGYGRVGQSIAHLLDKENIPYVALDLDASLVREAHDAGEPVYYGDSSERGVLESVGIDHARLMVVSHADVSSALRALAQVRITRPDLPVVVRTRDESTVEKIMSAGALHVVPETLEASLTMASQVLLLLGVSSTQVMDYIQQQRAGHYLLMRDIYRGEDVPGQGDPWMHRLARVEIPSGSRAVGIRLGDLSTPDVVVNAIIRNGRRLPSPSDDTQTEGDDILLLYGSDEELRSVINSLQNMCREGLE